MLPAATIELVGSHPDAGPGSDCPRCGGCENKFLAVRVTPLAILGLTKSPQSCGSGGISTGRGVEWKRQGRPRRPIAPPRDTEKRRSRPLRTGTPD